MSPNEQDDAGTVLVTGAAGFIGSAVVENLLGRGLKVVAMDHDFSAGRLSDELPVTRVEGDVRDEELIAGLVGRVDRVVHLAAIADVRRYSDETLAVLETNLMGARNVFRAALAAGVPVVFASSSEALGKNALLMREDSDSVFGPSGEARWAYGVSKLATEHWAWAMRREGLAVAGLRYFNVYGPLLDRPGRGRVISQFVGALRAGEPLSLVDGGHAVRSFCYIDDAAEATARLCLALEGDSPLVGRAFNVGRDEPVTMRELAARMIALSGGAARTRDVPGKAFFGEGFAEIPRRVPDVGALEEALDFRATTSLDAGLRAVLDHWGLLPDDAEPAPPPTIPNVQPSYEADRALLDRLGHSLRVGRTTNHGPEVVAFEGELTRYLCAGEVVAVRSGSSALSLSLRAMELSGAAVLPSYTYIATLNAVERADLEPIFCDLDPRTFTLSTTHLEELLEARPDISVVVPVSVFGVWPDMPAIERLAGEHGAQILHDAAHAFGTCRGEERVAGAPRATCFSFHATKVLPAVEGGAVVTRDADLAERLRALRNHGLMADPRLSVTGENAKLDELSAATARHGLARIDGILTRRRAYAARLREAAVEAGFTVQEIPPGVQSNFQNLALSCPRPVDEVIASLARHGVEARRYFALPLHTLARVAPCAPLPHTEAVFERLLTLPLHSRMRDDELARITDALRAAAG